MVQQIHTHLFNGPFPGLPMWAGTRKVKPIWILLKQETVSGSGISWAMCKSAPRSRQITMPTPHHSVFYRPDALPAAQPTASKHWRHNRYNILKFTVKFFKWTWSYGIHEEWVNSVQIFVNSSKVSVKNVSCPLSRSILNTVFKMSTNCRNPRPKSAAKLYDCSVDELHSRLFHIANKTVFSLNRSLITPSRRKKYFQVQIVVICKVNWIL